MEVKDVYGLDCVDGFMVYTYFQTHQGVDIRLCPALCVSVTLQCSGLFIYLITAFKELFHS